MTFRLTPRGPFTLSRQTSSFGDWQRTPAGDVVLAFPVEGWAGSAAVVLRQDDSGDITGDVHGSGDPEHAWQQALAVLSLDEDGSGFPAVGKRDPVIGELQRASDFLRPVLFHSPYEAACGFLIGHRIRITQARAIRARLAAAYGESIDVGGTTFAAFPDPRRLLELTDVPELPEEKLRRVHDAAAAALEGRLDRAHLRELPLADALAEARSLRGVGDFFAQGIVLRGAGVVDAMPGDAVTRSGVQHAYGLDAPPGDEEFDRIAEAWRPYRMWCSVLVHANEREERA